MPADECHGAVLMISQHLFRQQAITKANIEEELCRHMASRGHNE